MATPEEICWGKKPPGWQMGDPWGAASTWRNYKKLLLVLGSVEEKDDGKKWLHISVSHRRRMPSYEEMCYVKKHWIGDEHKAIEVHAPVEEHFNFHEHCRHLWCCLGEDPLPDMRVIDTFTGVKGV